MLKIGIDVGGVLSKYVDVFFQLIETLEEGNRSLRAKGCEDAGVEVFIISDMHPVEKIRDMLRRNGFAIPFDHVYSADYDRYGEECKAVLCEQLGIDLLIDDHMAYVSIVGNPLVRLLVMSDYTRPYYETKQKEGDSHWETDGSEGDFGRRTGGKRP